MAITKINLSDQITSIVLKSNDISNTLGDPALIVTGDSNLVDGINTLRDIISPFDDSSEIVAIGRGSLSANKSGGFGNLTYDSDYGLYTYTGPDSNELRSLFSGNDIVNYDSASGTFSLILNSIDGDTITDSTINASKFADVVTLQLKTSDGNTVKTLYSPGS